MNPENHYPFCFLPLDRPRHLSVLILSSKKAFGIYWYIYSPWQSTRDQIYQQYSISFSWNTEDEDRQGLNPEFHLQGHLWTAAPQIDKISM